MNFNRRSLSPFPLFVALNLHLSPFPLSCAPNLFVSLSLSPPQHTPARPRCLPRRRHLRREAQTLFKYRHLRPRHRGVRRTPCFVAERRREGRARHACVREGVSPARRGVADRRAAKAVGVSLQRRFRNPPEVEVVGADSELRRGVEELLEWRRERRRQARPVLRTSVAFSGRRDAQGLRLGEVPGR